MKPLYHIDLIFAYAVVIYNLDLDPIIIIIIIIIIHCRNMQFLVAGCLIRGRSRWYHTLPHGTTSEFRIWNRAFQERNPYQFPGRMINSPCFCLVGAQAHDLPHTQISKQAESHTLLVRPWRGVFYEQYKHSPTITPPPPLNICGKIS